MLVSLERDEEKRTERMDTVVVLICETLKATTTHGLTGLLRTMELKFAAQKAQGGINKTSTIILMKKKPCKFVDFKSMKKKV